jgi:hypothetical protein
MAHDGIWAVTVEANAEWSAEQEIFAQLSA